MSTPIKPSAYRLAGAGLLLSAAMLPAQTATDPNEGLTLLANPAAPHAYEVSWWGKPGRTYFIGYTDDLLSSWSYFPAVEHGQDAVVRYGFTNAAPKVFVRLRYFNEVLSAPLDMDSDGDGLSNLEEMALGTDLFSADSDRDGLPDGWEANHGLNPRQSAALDDDWDGDGLADIHEYHAQTDPRKPHPGWLHIELPAHLTPVAGTASGVAVLHDGTNYWRWMNGELSMLGAYLYYPNETAVTTDVSVGESGDVVIRTRNDETLDLPYTQWSDRRTDSIVVYPADGSASWSWSAPHITTRNDHTDNMSLGPNGVFQYWVDHDESNALDSLVVNPQGEVFASLVAGKHSFTDYENYWEPATFEWFRYDLVKLAPGGTAATTVKSDIREFTGLGATDIPLGVYSQEYPNINGFVGSAAVDFRPQAINSVGRVLGVDTPGNRFLWDTGDTRTPLPAFTSSSGLYYWDEQGRINAWEYLSSTFVYYLLTPTGENGAWRQVPHAPLPVPTGWVTNHKIALGQVAAQLGLASISGSSPRPFLALPNPARLLVDADRDGVIEPNPTWENDLTTPKLPFRFWINDDDDEVVNYTWSTTADNLVPPGYLSPGIITPSIVSETEEDDKLVTTSSEDWKDLKPDCARDLEDFARLQIYIGGLHEAVKSGQLALGVKWVTVTSGNPSVRLHRHAESNGDSGYLFNPTAASSQLDMSFNEAVLQIVDGTNYLVEGSSTVPLPARWFSNLSEQNPKVNLLFEGGQAGTGELKLVILKKEGTTYTEIGEGPGVWLDLKRPNELVERYSCGDGHLGAVSTVSRHANSAQFPSPTKDEEKDYVLYVHGYNMAEFEKQRWIETTYKRLWHLGYKGRVGGFTWPCAQSAPPFDDSEERGWASAVELKNHLQNLKARGYRVHVLAHSQGNVLVSEALRQWKEAGNSTPLVSSYIASQAAVAASAYNPSAPLMPNPGNETPDVYSNYPPTGRPYFAPTDMTGAASRYVNFLNPVDYALTSASGNFFSWEKDQALKPNIGYGWNPFDGFYQGAAGIRTGPIYTFPADRFTIFSYCAKAKSVAVGAVITGGVFTGSLNMENTLSFGPEHIYHSAQFRSSLSKRYQYWMGVLDAAFIPRLTP